eukprot:TRINITY_DN8061_c0_g2_i1.p1 TRINITY_DN8061_c0_g2~~TRINITY_DN8061_c0_g2_i1.p1  ORF type:complete len:470 (-),score=70.99 TRINITY_DN8061_c0_g2_i1:307-1716(-)
MRTSKRLAAAEEPCSDVARLVAASRRVVKKLRNEALDVGRDAPDLNGFSIFDGVPAVDRGDVMRLAREDPRGSRAIGAMVAMAVADSVGHMFEFLPVCTKGSRFNPKTLKFVGVFNKFKLKLGQWTDDTSMGLCLADSLLARGNYDGTDIRVRFWNWWNRGYDNAFRLDCSRHQSVGLGGNISMSLASIKNAQPPPRFEAKGEDAGNGSLMRLAPVPIFFHADEKLAMLASAESSYSTHPGPIAADACAFVAFVICRAINREVDVTQTAADFLDSCVAAYSTSTDLSSQPNLARLLQADEPVGSKERCWNWRDPAGPFLRPTLLARGSTYNGYPVSAGYFGSYSMDGLAIALHSVYHTTSLMDAITKCVNFLGDSDSTGAICGQIAGAFYGESGVDARLVEALCQWDGGEIALRGALLYGIGCDMPDETRARARDYFVTRSANEKKRPRSHASGKTSGEASPHTRARMK